MRQSKLTETQSKNEERHHDALVGLPPTTDRAQLEAKSSPVTVSR